MLKAPVLKPIQPIIPIIKMKEKFYIRFHDKKKPSNKLGFLQHILKKSLREINNHTILHCLPLHIVRFYRYF